MGIIDGAPFMTTLDSKNAINRIWDIEVTSSRRCAEHRVLAFERHGQNGQSDA
jgi:hypothetical protein